MLVRSAEERKKRKSNPKKSKERDQNRGRGSGRRRAPAIENIKAEKLEGPRILGKIDLPANTDTRPVKDEKRKRKRIFIEKREVKPDNVQARDRRPGGGPGGFNRDQRGRTGDGGPGRRTITRREDKLIDEKEIQEKIRETQAKLSGGGGKGKSMKAKARREKRGQAEAKVKQWMTISCR
jgi:translation initiation factor IF-2